MIEAGLHLIHPGQFLAETLRELRIPRVKFAGVIHVSPSRVARIIDGKQSVTPELALRFGCPGLIPAILAQFAGDL